MLTDVEILQQGNHCAAVAEASSQEVRVLLLDVRHTARHIAVTTPTLIFSKTSIKYIIV